MKIALDFNEKVHRELFTEIDGLTEPEAACRILLLASTQAIQKNGPAISPPVIQATKEPEEEIVFNPEPQTHAPKKEERGFNVNEFASDFDSDEF